MILNPFEKEFTKNDRVGCIFVLAAVAVNGFLWVSYQILKPINAYQLCLITRSMLSISLMPVSLVTEIWIWPDFLDYVYLVIAAVGMAIGLIFQAKGFSTLNLASASIVWNTKVGVDFIAQALVLGIPINLLQSFGIVVVFSTISTYQYLHHSTKIKSNAENIEENSIESKNLELTESVNINKNNSTAV